MVSSFDKFLNDLSASLGLPGAPLRNQQPAAPPREVVRTPRVPSPYQNATPQQQQQIAQASRGLPPDLVAQIAQAAAQPAAQFTPRKEVFTAAEAPVAPQQKSPFAANDGEGYVLVEVDTNTEQGTAIVAVPERYSKNLPDSARIYGDGRVIPAGAKDAIAGNNQLLEQQPPEIQSILVAPEQKQVEANREVLIVEDADGKIHTLDANEPLPAGMKVIRRGGGVQEGERVVSTGSPTTIGPMTAAQEEQALKQNTAKIDAEGNVISDEPEEELHVLSLEELREIDNDEIQNLANQLEASGITEWRSDMEYMTDGDGKLVAVPRAEYEAAVGPLEPMTTNIMRDKHGMIQEANELEAQGIFVIPDDRMAVKRNGRWSVVAASETPPSDVEDVVYGGVSKPMDDKSVFGDMDDLKTVPGSLLSGSLDILSTFDKPRRWTNKQMGDVLYERASGNDVDLPGWDQLTGFIFGPQENPLDVVKNSKTGTIGDWADENPDKVIDLYENGYDSNGDGVVDFTGGEAVFEYWVGNQNKFNRVVGELAGDPFNWMTLGGGALRKSGREILGEAAETTLGRRLLGQGLDRTGRLLSLPDEVMDTLVAKSASKTYRTITTEGGRQRVSTGLAKVGTSAPVRGVRKLFEESPEMATSLDRQAVDQSLLSVSDSEAIYRDGGSAPSAATRNAAPPASAVDAPVVRQPIDTPAVDTPTVDAPVVNTPPIPQNVIETLPPHQRALYENWDRQPLDLGNESPFSYREDGAIDRPDWDFPTPFTDEEGMTRLAIENPDDYVRRIIDETYVRLAEKMPDRWKFFVESHDPKVRRFVQRERELQAISFSTKDARKALPNQFDSAHMQLSEINEARYVIDELIPDFQRAFPGEPLPEYRIKNKTKGDLPTAKDNDQTLLEAVIFGDDKTSAQARRLVGNRAFDKDDLHLQAMVHVADDYRARYLARLSGEAPPPPREFPQGRISTEVPQEVIDAPAIDDPGLRMGEEPQRGLGLPTEAQEAARRKRWNRANNFFRSAARKAGIEQEWISAYARRKGYASAADLPEELMAGLERQIRTSPDAMRDMFQASFDASGPRAAGGIEQMTPNEISTTWGMNKRQLKKNLGIDQSLQPRSSAFDEEHVRGIIENYVPERMDPIIVKRGNDGKSYVVAGHNRLEAARRMNVPVPVRYTDASGDELLRLSRETNMQSLGMSHSSISSSVRQMVDEGKSFEEIGRALKLSPDGIAKTPATMAERYYNYSFLRDGSNLHRLTDQGILPMEISANAGRGIRNGNLTQAEVESLAFRVSDNRLNPKKFDDILKRAIKNAEEGKSRQMGGLLEGMDVTDNLKFAEDEVDRLWGEWRSTHDEWKVLNEKKLEGSITGSDRARLAQLEADKVRLANELSIPEDKLYARQPTPDGYFSRDYQVDGTDAPGATSVADEAPAPVADDAAPAQSVDAPADVPVEKAPMATHPLVEDAIEDAQKMLRRGSSPENIRTAFNSNMDKIERTVVREYSGDVYAYLDDARMRVSDTLNEISKGRKSHADVVKLMESMDDPYAVSTVLARATDDDIAAMVREIRDNLQNYKDYSERAIPTYDRLRSAVDGPAGADSKMLYADIAKADVQGEAALTDWLRAMRDAPEGRDVEKFISSFKRQRGSRSGAMIRGVAEVDAPVPTASAAPAPNRPQFGDTSYVDDVPEPRLDADGNPIVDAAQQMRDSGASPLFSRRMSGISDATIRSAAPPGGRGATAAVMAYGSPFGQWEMPNLNLSKRFSGLNRKVANPNFARGTDFLPDAPISGDRSPRTEGGQYWNDRARAAEPDVEMVRGRVINEWDSHVLGQRYDDGESVLERWDRLSSEYEGRGLTAQQAEARAADQAIADWAEQVIKNYDTNHGTSFHEKYLKELDRVQNNAKEPLEGTHAQLVAASNAMGGTNKVNTFYDEYLGVMREMTLYNVLSGPRYVMTQLIGNTITAMITGNFSAVGRAARDYKSAYQQMSGETNNRILRMLGGIDEGELTPHTMRTSLREMDGEPAMMLHDTADRMMIEFNISGARDDITNVVRDEVTTVGRPTKFSNLRLGSMNFGKRTDGVFANKHIRDMANAWDLSFRKAMWAETMKNNNAGARIAMRQRMMDTMPSSLPTSEFDRMWDELPEVFGADRIRTTFGDVDAKWADRMARDWQYAIRQMNADAVEKTHKLFFSGYERNADKALRKVVFFHYWMSRATPLYTEALMRNPGLLNAYIGMLQEIKEQEESGKYGAAVNGFLKFMSTPFGFNIFIRPDAFLQTVFALNDGSDFTPEGETFIGAIMRKTPLMFNPLVDAGANLMGLKGDTFAPDPLMLGQWSNLATNSINFFQGLTGIGDGQPSKNKYTDAMNYIRSKTSGIIPGTENIPMTDSTQYARRDINYFIMEEAEARGLDPVGVEAIAAMDDPDSDLYKAAYKKYGAIKMAEHGLRFFPLTSPLYPKIRTEAGDDIRWTINNAEPGSSEREVAYRKRQLAQTSDPAARKLIVQQNEYTSLGTDEERDAYGVYNAIQYGGLKEPVVIDGVAVNDYVLFGMSSDDRKKAADAWAKQSGNADKVDRVKKLRKEYRESHPEYAAYFEWRMQASNYEGGAFKYWEDLAEGNPNAERYLNSIEEGERSDVEMQLTGVTAYMEYMGIRPTIYDPNPISINNGQGQPYNPAAGQDSGGWNKSGGGSGGTTIQEDIDKFNQQAEEMTAKYGDLQKMTPPMRQATIQLMRDNGDTPPYLSKKAQEYIEWAERQPEGSDRSIPAYEEWKEGQETEDSETSYSTSQTGTASGFRELLSMLQL